MNTIFNAIKPKWAAHKDKSNIEIEFRLGRINNHRFDTNVGEYKFHKLLTGLHAYTAWKEVKEQSFTDYYKGDIRVRFDESTENITSIKKNKLHTENFKLEDKPLDTRLAIVHEEPIEFDSNTEMDYELQKYRTSFIRRNLSIDMTVVTGTNPRDEIETEDIQSYQVELEIINPNEIDNFNELYNICYKIECLLRLI